MTKEEAKEYINNYLSHIISMSEYGNWFASEIKDLVNDCKNDCDEIIENQKSCNTKKQSNIYLKLIELRLDKCASEVSDFILKQSEELIDSESDWLEENVAKPLDLSLIYPEKAKSLLLLIPIATAGVIGSYGETIKNRLYEIYKSKVMTSYVSGLSFEDLEENYTPRYNTFDRWLQTESENIGSSLSSQYDRIVYTKNDKKIKGYIWSAILDAHTCLVCGSLDGQKFTDIDKTPMYPVHLNCRCTLIPFTENIEDVIPETYEQWFENQSQSEKRSILGKTRFQLYEQGMKIKNFVNNGKITPLKDLK